MSDNFNAKAELEVRLDGIRELLNDLENAKDGIADLDNIQAKWTNRLKETKREISGVERELKKTGAAARGAKGDLGVDRSDLSEWDDLSAKIQRAELEYKSVARAAAASGRPAPVAKKVAADQGLSSADIDAYRRGSSANLLADLNGAEAALPRLRYALYDVATTAGITSTAITGLGVASVAAFASMESSFTNVERTMGSVSSAQIQALRQELVGLAREIPLTFANISEIATLGNQLGIASSDIAQFTETTAKFSAVTGLTAEASAQAFGSLGELLNVQSQDYEALGSSIALVGRKSVATEQEIVAMTTRLAASATNAGFTAQQVIALSGAFASLRIAPERAQGVMEVYFNRLNTAIAEGGPRLEAFARIAGETVEGVESLARTDPTTLFQKLAVGLGEMDSIAQTGALKELGLQGIRAGEVFGRVSANVEVFNSALADANQGWTEGTELGAQYAKVVDDLASRWQIFLNSVQEAGAAVGAILAPALGAVLNVLTLMAQGFASIAENPVGKVFVALAAFAAAAGAALFGLIATGALFLASAAAMKTAMAELTVGGATAGLSLRGLAGAATAVGTAMGFSAGAMKAFKVALMSTGIGIAVVALGTLAAGIYEATTAAGGFSAEAKEMGDALNRAIAADTTSFEETGNAVATYSRELKSAAPAADEAARAAAEYAGVQSEAGSSIDDATQKIKDQTVALGENAEAYFRNQLAQDQDFQNFANDDRLRAAAEQAGFTIGELISSGMQTQGGFTAYVEQIRAEADRLKYAVPTDTGQWDAATFAMIEQRDRLYEVANALDGYAGKMDETRAAADAAAVATEYAGAATATAKEGYTEVGEAATQAAEGMWSSQQALIDAEGQLYRLGSTLGENAGMWDAFSEGGRANLAALYEVLDAIAAETPGNASAIASNFQALYDALISGGAASADQLGFLQQKIIELANTGLGALRTLQSAGAAMSGPLGGAISAAGRLGETVMSASAVQPASRNFSSLFNGISTGAAKAAKAVGGGGGGKRGGGGGGLAGKIRTLVDYANDLSGVWKRAFDIRFGGQQGLDSISSGWQKIADASAKAREEVAQYQATLAGIAADEKIKRYWLMVAENYGDELRATKLRAELTELATDQAKAQNDLAKAQGGSSKELEGNSSAAIENRETILDMVGSYQDLLKSYAANGMSQADLQKKAAQLKQEFIAQAVQAGFSRAEVAKYALAFDDMAIAIQRVPRNVTVAANVSPALQALAEFEARAQTAARNASNSIRTGGGGGYSVPTPHIEPFVVPIKFKMPSYAQLMEMQAAIRAMTGDKNFRIAVGPGGQGGQVFKTGGYTGGNSVNDIVGAVHGKEYVMSAPAVRTLGVNGMNFMHNMLKSGRVPSMGAASGTSGMVELSPFDRALLIGIQEAVGITIDGRTLQSVVNGANANMAHRRSA